MNIFANLSENIAPFIENFSYLAIFGLMIANGVFSFPSSQVLFIIVGYFVGADKISLAPALVAGALGNTIGNAILYEITRRHGVKAALAYLPLTPAHITKAENYFAKKGLMYLFLGKLTPALKVFVPVAGGIGRAPRIRFNILMFVASLIWAAVFIAIGFYFGMNTGLWKKYSVALFVLAGFVAVFAYRGFKNQEV